MEPEVSFVGAKLLPGKTTRVGGTSHPESSIWTLHITQFALAAGAKPGKNTITLIQDNAESFTLGTLEKDRCEQFQVLSRTLPTPHILFQSSSDTRSGLTLCNTSLSS